MDLDPNSLVPSIEGSSEKSSGLGDPPGAPWLAVSKGATAASDRSDPQSHCAERRGLHVGATTRSEPGSEADDFHEPTASTPPTPSPATDLICINADSTPTTTTTLTTTPMTVAETSTPPFLPPPPGNPPPTTCIFGCPTTTQISKKTGRQMWESIPLGSTWWGLPQGATLCHRHYQQGWRFSRRWGFGPPADKGPSMAANVRSREKNSKTCTPPSHFQHQHLLPLGQ